MRKSLCISLLPAAAGMLLLLACQKAEPVSPRVDGAVPILFRSGGPFAVSGIRTRAVPVVDDDALAAAGFNVSATTGPSGNEASAWNNVAFTRSGSTWAGGKWWPQLDPEYHFYAANADLTFAKSGTTVSVSNDRDVVCAYLPDPAFRDENTLCFEHVFARVGEVTVEAVDGYTLSGVSIALTPLVSGTYDLRSGAGQTDGTGWSGTAGGSETVISPTAAGTRTNDLYLVPGTYTLTASWTATRGDYTETFSGKTATLAFTGGKVNSIVTTLGGQASEIVMSVSVADWGSASTDITFPMD